jgi:hypothetical protein
MNKVFDAPRGCARVGLAALAVVGLPAMAEVVSGVSVEAPSFEFVVNYTDTLGAARQWAGAVPTASFVLNQATGDWDLAQDWSASIGGGSVLLSLKANDPKNGGNADPFLSYSFNATNKSAGVVTYQHTVTQHVFPGVIGPNQVRASMAYALTDVGNNGVTLTPSPNVSPQDANNGPETQIFRLTSSAAQPGVNNASWKSAGVDVGTAKTHTGFGAGVFSFQEGFIAGPIASSPTTQWNWMQTRTRFTLTGGGDSVGISGYAEIVPVPEASQWAMMIVGLGLVGGATKLRRRSSQFVW